MRKYEKQNNPFVYLTNVTVNDAAILYTLLKERTKLESISHKEIPTWEDHWCFVANAPYTRWYIIDNGSRNVGAIYLSRPDNFGMQYIGIAILKKYRRKGYALSAIEVLLHECKEMGVSPVANINPANKKSIALFEKAGFKLIQQSYKFTQP